MDRFNRMIRQVRDVGLKFILRSLTTTLKPRPLADSLFTEPPQTMGELQNRAARFVRVEDMRAFQKIQKEALMQPIGQKSDRKEKRKLPIADERRGGRPALEKDHKVSYPPLGASHTRNYEEVMQARRQYPRQKHEVQDGERGRYCRYHRHTGHNTEDCLALKDKTKEFIREGQSKKHVRGDS